MPQLDLYYRGVFSVEAAVRELIPYLEDTGRAAHNAIYFDGWDGLAASAVLRSIAERPPPSLLKKFDRIIHVDCSRWKSRRVLQRAIADELKLPQAVMAAFDRQDEEDDFSKVDESSRSEIEDVTREIYQTIGDLSCLVIFHNGSDETIDMADFGFTPHRWLSNKTNKVLWTFRGRLRLNSEIKEKVDSSHLHIYRRLYWGFDHLVAQLILEEAKEIVNYIQHNKQAINPKMAAKCISYLLWFNKKGGGAINYDWATHASNYWVCDGIVEGDGQFDEPWDVSATLQQQIRMEDCSFHEIKDLDKKYTQHWKSVTKFTSEHGGTTNTTISSKLTSFFLTPENGLYITLPPEMFQQSEGLCVLQLSRCSFSFYAPPFCYCRGLRFLGLSYCKNQQQEEGDKQGRPVMEFFRSLWVLDVSHMDWELNLSEEVIEKMVTNIREVYVNKGRIWHNNLLLWRVIEPTCSSEASKKDEFVDMVKLELLHLSGDNIMQVLPSLSATTCLKTLVLDGCVGLEHIGPEGLPASLESFSLIAGSSPDKVTRINLVGCVHLERFLLRGAFPVLEELNLSGTSVKQVDLNDQMVQVPGLKRLFLLGCECKFLVLSINSAIQVLPSLSGASCLKTLILDGCAGLEQLDPEKLPQSSLEFFSLAAGVGKDSDNNARISHISLAGCARLANVRLRGLFPKLEELDLSHTGIKMLDLTKVVDVRSLKAIFLVGCEQLRSIVWPENGMEQLELLCIDTRGGGPVTVRNTSIDSDSCRVARSVRDVSLVSLEQEKYFHAFVSSSDISSLQLLVVPSGANFCWGWPELFKVNICLSSSTFKDDIRKTNEETVSTGWQIPKASHTYTDVATGNTFTSEDNNKNSAAQLEPLASHLEVSEGIIREAESQSMQGIRAVTFVINSVQSLHVHDNSSITTVIPEHMTSVGQVKIDWNALNWCQVERCPKLDTVFNIDYNIICFKKLKTFSAAHLLTARSVWSRGITLDIKDSTSFAKLRAIHMHFCPRLKFVLPLSWFYTLSSLEALHIVYCGDLRQVFRVEAEFLNQIAIEHQNGMLEFPMLKDLYLHQLSSLRQICETKMFAPKLETVRLRGCWGLRRLPATELLRRDGPCRVVVDCEKDWWDNLEWDGLHVGHHPSLFAPHHPAYYKKRHLRGTVLR